MELSREGEVWVLQMNAGRANAMGRSMLGALSEQIDRLAGEPAGPLVITAPGGTFSAGLALPELIDLDRDGMRSFMELFERTMRKVFALGRPVVAAINGHAIAGGCVLALQADARVMARGKGKIGLNEAALGIGLPASVVEPLRAQVPAASLGPLALEGRLLSADEALQLGLIDEAAEPAELLPRALARARALGATPATAYAQIKGALRRPALEALDRTGAEELSRWLDTWFAPAGRQRVSEVVARLRG